MISHVAHVLPGFLAACLVLAALPGPATALFLHRTVRDGNRAGLAAVAGNEIGVFCWLLAGGAGLSALLAANRFLFDGLHAIGGLVLVALGVSAWRGAGRGAEAARPPTGRARSPEAAGPRPGPVPRGRTPAAAFRASLLSIAANPKAAVFAISFFPQFLPRSGPVLPTVLVLATIQVILDTAWCVGIVLAAGRVRGWLSRRAIRRRIERTLGAVLVALGADLVVQTR